MAKKCSASRCSSRAVIVRESSKVATTRFHHEHGRSMESAEGEERQKAAAGTFGSGCASTMMVALGMVALLILAVLIT